MPQLSYSDIQALHNQVCEALICGYWRLVHVEDLLSHNYKYAANLIKRCHECHWPINLHGKEKGVHKVHFEHLKWNKECQLSAKRKRPVRID